MISEPFFSGASLGVLRLHLADVERRVDPAAVQLIVVQRGDGEVAIAAPLGDAVDDVLVPDDPCSGGDERAGQRPHGIATVGRLIALQFRLD